MNQIIFELTKKYKIIKRDQNPKSMSDLLTINGPNALSLVNTTIITNCYYLIIGISQIRKILKN